MANPRIQAVITADDKASKVISGVGKSFSDFSKKAGVAMVAVGAGLTVIAKKSTDYTTDLVKNTKQLSRETGISERESSRLLFVTNRLGLGVDQVSTTFGIFSKRITQSATDTSKQKDSFDKLGVSVKTADGHLRPFNDVLLDTADKFKSMEDGPKKTALAMDLFGRSGKDMIKVLNLGSKGIQELQQRADELGLTLTKDNIAKVTKYIQAQKDLTDSTNALKLQIGLLTAPVLTSFNNKLNQVITSLLDSSGAMKTVVTNVVAFGGPILSAGGAVLGFSGNIAQLNQGLGLAVAKFAGITGAVIAGTVATGALAYKTAELKNKFGENSAQVTALNAVLVVLTPQLVALNTVVSSLGAALMGNRANTERLKVANDNLKASQENLKLSTESLKKAQLDQKGATLSVERSQRNYNEAVRQFGPKSLEAREASYNLKRAKDSLKEATNNSKKAEEEHQKRLKEKKAYEQAQINVANTSRVAEENQSAFNRAAGAVGGYIRQLFRIPAKVNNPKAGGGGGGGGGGGFATGTDFYRTRKYAGGTSGAYGGMALVGERGPEMVTLPRGSKVSRADETRKMMGGVSNINISINAGAYLGSQQEARKHAKVIYQALVEMAGMKGQTLQQLIAGGR